MSSTYTEDTRQKAVQMYRDGMTTKDIASAIGCGRSTIYSWLKATGILLTKKCQPNCDCPKHSRDKHQPDCSCGICEKPRNKFALCQVCGQKFEACRSDAKFCPEHQKQNTLIRSRRANQKQRQKVDSRV